MKPGLRAAVVAIALVTLAACGGGGGGGGGGSPAIGAPPVSEVAFTSFAAVLPNQTVVADGIAATGTGNQFIAPPGNYTITSANGDALAPVTIRLTYDGAATPVLRQINISSTGVSPSLVFDRDIPGQSITCNGGTFCLAKNATGTAVVVDAVAAGWNYQSLGVWTLDVTPTTWVLGGASVGAATIGSSLPTTGTAVFNGLATGAYLDSSGTPFATMAGMRANVNFGTRNIDFSTSNTALVNSNTLVDSTNNGLNLSGTLSYAPGVNSFNGGLTTTNGALTGQASGRFYGPSAQEVGGVYSLSGAGVTRMIGGFGGKR